MLHPSMHPAETDLTAKLTLLQIHRQTVHPTPVATQTAPPLAPAPCVRLDPPKLSAGSDQETWKLFLRSWGLYKTGMRIQDDQSSVYLFNCLDRDLRDDILRANPSTQIGEMSEADLTAAVKTLAVKVESKLVHRIRMGQATQPPGHSIRNFHATLKGQAKLCQLKVNCPTCQTVIDYSDEVFHDQLVRGSRDKEILADLLCETKTDLTLPEVVAYIARKEQAKTEQNTVSCESANSVQHTSSSPGQEEEPPAGLVKANTMAPTTSRPGRRSAQLGSPPATSAKARVTYLKPAQNAHIVEAGVIRAIRAKNAPRVSRCRAGPTRSARCMPTCVPPS